MKKRLLSLLFVFLALICVQVFAEDIAVTVSVEGESNSFALKEKLKIEAQKAAIKKYLQSMKKSESTIIKAQNEYTSFVDDTEQLSSEWISLGKNNGQLKGSFEVSVMEDKLNKWLEKHGDDITTKAGVELTIMEERPSAGQMKLDKAFGNDFDGAKFFMQNYTTFQRRIRDAIVKKVDSIGYDVKLLEDNDLYEEFKSKDATLVGVFFDVNKNDFEIDTELMNAIKENNPDTLLLYYRIDSLIFEESTRKITTTVAISVKNLRSNITKVVGSKSFSVKSNSTGIDGVIDDMVKCAEQAMNLLMKEEGTKKLNDIIITLVNQADKPKALVLQVNGSTFDSKIRKKVLYTLKKELVAKGLTTESAIKSTDNNLTATIDSKVKDLDELYIEHITPILEEMGVELSDDCVKYSGNTLSIKPE